MGLKKWRHDLPLANRALLVNSPSWDNFQGVSQDGFVDGGRDAKRTNRIW